MADSLTRAMLIRMVEKKELESEYGQMVKKIMHNGILIIDTE